MVEPAASTLSMKVASRNAMSSVTQLYIVSYIKDTRIEQQLHQIRLSHNGYACAVWEDHFDDQCRHHGSRGGETKKDGRQGQPKVSLCVLLFMAVCRTTMLRVNLFLFKVIFTPH